MFSGAMLVDKPSFNPIICRNKKETGSYNEISESLGVDNPSGILFVTDVYQEAVAAQAAGNVQHVVSVINFAESRNSSQNSY